MARGPDAVRRRRGPVLLDVAREPPGGLLDVGQDEEDVGDRPPDGRRRRRAAHSRGRLSSVVFGSSVAFRSPGSIGAPGVDGPGGSLVALGSRGPAPAGGAAPGPAPGPAGRA